ncbi:hypothetical protein KKH46_01085 [Patescibacteria group bacterium]|nr:hypothetical protein [Patescibacteria group bacterium]MBU1956648.1 hypothetical protein [Patescibacteria group bacterium]
MSTKVPQDIKAPEDYPEENFERKWDYARDGSGLKERNHSNTTEKTSNTMLSSKKNQNIIHKIISGFSWKIGLVFVALIAIVLFLVIGQKFASANVKIVLSQQTVTLNNSFAATHNTSLEGVLSYQIVKLQETVTKDVQPTSEENVEQKATGQIVVYNKHNENQRLIINTRFEAPDGKIYRIKKPIVIPGAKGSGDTIVPGSLEVAVYADKPGQEYNNAGIVDFTVPGLKNTPLYNDIFAKSKTGIAGGYIGVLKSASEEDIQTTSQSLQQEIRTLLLSKIKSAIDKENILYDDMVFIDFTTQVPTEVSANGMLSIKGTGLLQAIVFGREELSGRIAEKTLSSYDGSTVLVRNLDDMKFTLENKEEFIFGKQSSFNFSLSGAPHIVWEIDSIALKNDLVGLPKGSMSTLAEKHSSIRKIEAKIKPFWRRSFPNNPDLITIEETLE